MSRGEVYNKYYNVADKNCDKTEIENIFCTSKTLKSGYYEYGCNLKYYNNQYILFDDKEYFFPDNSQTLTEKILITSKNGLNKFGLDSKGRLVWKAKNTTKISNSDGLRNLAWYNPSSTNVDKTSVIFRSNGDISIYNDKKLIWNFPKQASYDNKFILVSQDDGNLVIYDKGNKIADVLGEPSLFSGNICIPVSASSGYIYGLWVGKVLPVKYAMNHYSSDVIIYIAEENGIFYMVSDDNSSARMFKGLLKDISSMYWENTVSDKNAINQFIFGNNKIKYSQTELPVLYRPSIVDSGYPNPANGWYNAEGRGCVNYCRYVSDSNNLFFSCMDGSTTPNEMFTNFDKIYSQRGMYEENELVNIKCNIPESYTIGYISGSVLGKEVRVTNRMTLPSGKNVMIYQENNKFYMVTSDNSEAKIYDGSIYSVNSQNWNSYTSVSSGSLVYNVCPAPIIRTCNAGFVSETLITNANNCQEYEPCRKPTNLVLNKNYEFPPEYGVIIQSLNGFCKLEYKNGNVVWTNSSSSSNIVVSSNTGNLPQTKLTIGTDGILKLFNNDYMLWKSPNVSGLKDYRLIAQEDGNLIIRGSDNAGLTDMMSSGVKILPGIISNLYRPAIVDAGYPNMQKGWYDLEGRGCVNYCRYVGDLPNPFFSCMAGSETEGKVYDLAKEGDKIYSVKDKYTENGVLNKICETYPIRFTTGFIYGSDIGVGVSLPVTHRLNLPNGKIAVMVVQGDSVKMVTTDNSEARKYKGSINENSPFPWNNATVLPSGSIKYSPNPVSFPQAYNVGYIYGSWIGDALQVQYKMTVGSKDVVMIINSGYIQMVTTDNTEARYVQTTNINDIVSVDWNIYGDATEYYLYAISYPVSFTTGFIYGSDIGVGVSLPVTHRLNLPNGKTIVMVQQGDFVKMVATDNSEVRKYQGTINLNVTVPWNNATVLPSRSIKYSVNPIIFAQPFNIGYMYGPGVGSNIAVTHKITISGDGEYVMFYDGGNYIKMVKTDNSKGLYAQGIINPLEINSADWNTYINIGRDSYIYQGCSPLVNCGERQTTTQKMNQWNCPYNECVCKPIQDITCSVGDKTQKFDSNNCPYYECVCPPLTPINCPQGFVSENLVNLSNGCQIYEPCRKPTYLLLNKNYEFPPDYGIIIQSLNGICKLEYKDGNVVWYFLTPEGTTDAVSSNTFYLPQTKLTIGTDGVLRLYNNDYMLWKSPDISGIKDYRLIAQEDGNLIIRGSNNAVLIDMMTSGVNILPGTISNLFRPAIVDAGYPNMQKGWYDLEGRGCVNYCRYVGNATNPFFSCMSGSEIEGKVYNLTTEGDKVYSVKDEYTENGVLNNLCESYPVRFTTGFIYGSDIGNRVSLPVTHRLNLPNGKTIVMVQQGSFIKMVATDNSEARKYEGTINENNPFPWNNATVVSTGSIKYSPNTISYPQAYNVGYMYGPWIGDTLQVQYKMTVGSKDVVMIINSGYIQMVTTDNSEARFLQTTNINDIISADWNTYGDATRNYLYVVSYPIPFTSGFIYGSDIGAGVSLPVSHLLNLPNGKIIVMVEQGGFVKMLATDNFEARKYQGTINLNVTVPWNNATVLPSRSIKYSVNPIIFSKPFNIGYMYGPGIGGNNAVTHKITISDGEYVMFYDGGNYVKIVKTDNSQGLYAQGVRNASEINSVDWNTYINIGQGSYLYQGCSPQLGLNCAINQMIQQNTNEWNCPYNECVCNPNIICRDGYDRSSDGNGCITCNRKEGVIYSGDTIVIENIGNKGFLSAVYDTGKNKTILTSNILYITPLASDVTYADSYKFIITANGYRIGDPILFPYVDNGLQVRLKSVATGLYCRDDDDWRISCNSNYDDPYTTFRLFYVNGVFSLYGARRNGFCQQNQNQVYSGGYIMMCSSPSVGNWESFKFRVVGFADYYDNKFM